MSVPVVIVGQNENLASHAIKYLAPEYEVVTFIANGPDAVEQIPLVLAGKPVPSNGLGTQNFDGGVQAIIVGGTVDDATFQQIRDAVGPVSSVPWLKYDASKPEPAHTPEGGAELIKRIKSAFATVQLGQDSVTPY